MVLEIDDIIEIEEWVGVERIILKVKLSSAELANINLARKNIWVIMISLYELTLFFSHYIMVKTISKLNLNLK